MARVLVVDGDPTSLGLAVFALEFEGHEPVGFDSPKAALNAARTEPYDAAVLDLAMPEIDGWELLRLLSIYPETSDLPVLVLSGDTYTLLYRLTQLPRSDVRGLAKPYDIAEFVNEVQQLAAYA